MIERALVAFARGSGAWVLFAAGDKLNDAIDHHGRDADELGLLRSKHGWEPPMRGLWVWQGLPGHASAGVEGRWASTFDGGHWRKLTVDEWVQVEKGNLALWPYAGVDVDEGFHLPRA